MEEIKVAHLKANGQNIESWLAMYNNEIIGHIYMVREDDKKIKFLDAWVHADHRRKGIFRLLWDTRWEYVQQNYSGWLVYAWCKEMSLPLLMEKGFISGEVCTYVEKKIN